jgi:hypothetical protein
MHKVLSFVHVRGSVFMTIPFFCATSKNKILKTLLFTFAVALLPSALYASAAAQAGAPGGGKSAEAPFIFPPSSQVEFKGVKAEWIGGTAKPAVRLNAVPVARWRGGVGLPISVVSLAADVSLDQGRTWSVYEFKPSGSAPGAWEVTIELPEWSKPARAAAPTIEPATATVCFTAFDSAGNSTVELPQQTAPQYENQIHFTRIMTDPRETESAAPDYKNDPDRDILDVSAAWLRENLFLKVGIAGTTVPEKMVAPGFDYIVPRFVPLDTDPIAERAGQGLEYDFLVNPKSLPWPRTNPFGDKPFFLWIDAGTILNLRALASTPDDALSDTLKIFKKDLEDRKIDPASDVYSRTFVGDSGLLASALADRIYWKINKSSLDPKTPRVEGVRIIVFSGYLESPDQFDLNTDDLSHYSTVYFRRRTLTAGRPGLREDYTELKAPPVALPPAPGASGGPK